MRGNVIGVLLEEREELRGVEVLLLQQLEYNGKIYIWCDMNGRMGVGVGCIRRFCSPKEKYFIVFFLAILQART